MEGVHFKSLHAVMGAITYLFFKLIKVATAILKRCHEVWHEQDRVSRRHQQIRTDAEVATAVAIVSQENMLQLLLDPIYSVFMECQFIYFLKGFLCFTLTSLTLFSSVVCLLPVQLILKMFLLSLASVEQLYLHKSHILNTGYS